MSEPRVSGERLGEMVKWIEGTRQMLEGMPSIHDESIDELALDLRDARARIEELEREREQTRQIMRDSDQIGNSFIKALAEDRDKLGAERDTLAAQVAVLREALEPYTRAGIDDQRALFALASTESVAREYRERIIDECIAAVKSGTMQWDSQLSSAVVRIESLKSKAGTAPMGSPK